MKTYLSVVIPCYNEEKNLNRGVLEEVYNYLSKQNYTWEVIISDDGSTDNSLIVAKNQIQKFKNFKVLENKHGGKPWAVWQGIKASKGEVVLFTDMDQSTPLGQIEKLLPWFSEGFDVVIGSRGIKRSGFNTTRQLASLAFRVIRGILILPEITDTQCGFKAFRTQVAKKIFPSLQFFQEMDKEVKGWRVSAFDVELLFIAKKWGYKIKEIFVKWKDEDVAIAEKDKKFLKESKQMAEEIFRVRKNDFSGKYTK